MKRESPEHRPRPSSDLATAEQERLESSLRLFRDYSYVLVAVGVLSELMLLMAMSIDERYKVVDILFMGLAALLLFVVGYFFTTLYFVCVINNALLRLHQMGLRIGQGEVTNKVHRHVRRTKSLHRVVCRIRGVQFDVMLAGVLPKESDG